MSIVVTNPVKILFINFPPQPIGEVKPALEGKSDVLPGYVIPMGVCYLSTALKERVGNVDIKLIDYAKELTMRLGELSSLEDLIRVPAGEIAEDFTPDVIGFSMLFSTCHPLFLVAATELKKIWPNAVMITGGNHGTNSVDVIVEHPNIDYVAKGECELAFSEFIKNFHRRDEIQVQGIYSRQHVIDKKPMPHSQAVDDLDELGFPDWEILDVEAYVTSPFKRSRTWKGEGSQDREISILTTRGCSFSCTFCAVHTTMGRKVRFRSVEHVIEEMRQLWDKYQVNLFLVEDDLFTANRKKVLPLLAAMSELSKDIPEFETQFPSALSVNTLFDDVMDALIDAGMKVTNVAIESGSKHVQRHIIKKNCNLDRAKEVVKYFRDRDVITRCYFIGGFPGETREMLNETLEYAKKLGCDWATFGIAAPLRGSEMYDQFIDLGYIKDDMAQWSSAFYQERIFDTPEIGADEIKDFFYRANLEVNFINNPNVINGNWEHCLQVFSGIVAGYPYHIFGWYVIMKAHAGLGDDVKAHEIGQNIIDLVENDDRAARLYRKFGFLIPDINIAGYVFDDDASRTNINDLDAPILSEDEMRTKPIMHNVGVAAT